MELMAHILHAAPARERVTCAPMPTSRLHPTRTATIMHYKVRSRRAEVRTPS